MHHRNVSPLIHIEIRVYRYNCVCWVAQTILPRWPHSRSSSRSLPIWADKSSGARRSVCCQRRLVCCVTRFTCLVSLLNTLYSFKPHIIIIQLLNICYSKNECRWLRAIITSTCPIPTSLGSVLSLQVVSIFESNGLTIHHQRLKYVLIWYMHLTHSNENLFAANIRFVGQKLHSTFGCPRHKSAQRCISSTHKWHSQSLTHC